MNIELYHENCLEWLRQQPTGSIGGVLTDPPDHRQGDTDLTEFLNDVLLHCLRVARGPIIIINPIQWEFETPRTTRLPPRWKPRPDEAGLWRTFYGRSISLPGQAATATSRGAAPVYVWRGQHPGHFEIPLAEAAIVGDRPSVKPLGLFVRLARLIPRGTILDPFCGYGTCLDAAKYLHRDCIAIENNRERFEDTRKRLFPNSKEDITRRDGSPGGWVTT